MNISRFLLVLYAIWCCAISWPRITLKLHKGDKADKNALANHWWGFRDPDLIWDQTGSASHQAIDYLVEWVRSNQQRAAKAGSFVILVLSALCVSLAGLLWFIPRG